jgi:hypothetical protein
MITDTVMDMALWAPARTIRESRTQSQQLFDQPIHDVESPSTIYRSWLGRIGVPPDRMHDSTVRMILGRYPRETSTG